METGRPTKPRAAFDAQRIRIALARKGWRVPELVAALAKSGTEVSERTIYQWMRRGSGDASAVAMMRRVLR